MKGEGRGTYVLRKSGERLVEPRTRSTHLHVLYELDRPRVGVQAASKGVGTGEGDAALDRKAANRPRYTREQLRRR